MRLRKTTVLLNGWQRKIMPRLSLEYDDLNLGHFEPLSLLTISGHSEKFVLFCTTKKF